MIKKHWRYLLHKYGTYTAREESCVMCLKFDGHCEQQMDFMCSEIFVQN